MPRVAEVAEEQSKLTAHSVRIQQVVAEEAEQAVAMAAHQAHLQEKAAAAEQMPAASQVAVLQQYLAAIIVTAETVQII